MRRNEAVVAPQLVVMFGGGATLEQASLLAEVASAYPSAAVVGCSTAGEICESHVCDDSLVVTAVQFDRTRVRMTVEDIEHDAAGKDACRTGCEAAGRRIASALSAPDLCHVLLFADGIHCDGASLLRGVNSGLGATIGITGGMAADAVHFRRTLVVARSGTDNTASISARERRVVAVGLYGDALHVGYGTLGGWDAFGPARVITRSSGCVVYELDGEPALTVYRRYLGEHGGALPASAVLFPLGLVDPARAGEIVRTVCAIDDVAGSMTCAGDLPEGAHLRLMRANVERLIDAASAAATVSTARMGARATELAVVVSCMGRKALMGAQVDEEVECVRGILGNESVYTGFYSYGEFAPLAPHTRSELHNQTLTVTTFSEG